MSVQAEFDISDFSGPEPGIRGTYWTAYDRNGEIAEILGLRGGTHELLDFIGDWFAAQVEGADVVEEVRRLIEKVDPDLEVAYREGAEALEQ